MGGKIQPFLDGAAQYLPCGAVSIIHATAWQKWPYNFGRGNGDRDDTCE